MFYNLICSTSREKGGVRAHVRSDLSSQLAAVAARVELDVSAVTSARASDGNRLTSWASITVHRKTEAAFGFCIFFIVIFMFLLSKRTKGPTGTKLLAKWTF